MEADSLNCIVLGNDVVPGHAGMGYFYQGDQKRNDGQSWSKMYRDPQNFCSRK